MKGDIWKPAKENDYPKDYFVPNFGPSPDIVNSQANLANTEKRMKHKIKLRSNKDVMDEWGAIRYDVGNYNRLNLGVDKDITDT